MRSLGAVAIGALIAAAPALTYAQHGGGGGGGGGGGHFGGGGHMGGGGGGYSGGGHGFGGGAVHFGGFGGRSMGSYGGSYGGHTFAAPHYGVAGHSYGGSYGGRYFASGGHGFTSGGAHYARAGFVARPGFVGHPATVAPHPGVGAPSATYYHGGGWHAGHAWTGGYWHGAYWPHCWYYPGWAWYLPVLPIGYATYWWGGVPYYYYNSLYYTWSPAQSGYVVTDPPPLEGTEGSADASGGYQQAPEANYSGSAGDVYVYPRNGQTPEQTENDRYECHGWAVSQSGFDPTRQDQTGNPEDYRRAMVACLDARGYSSR